MQRALLYLSSMFFLCGCFEVGIRSVGTQHQGSVGGKAGFILEEMKKDKVDQRIINKYAPEVKKAMQAKDKQRATDLSIKAVEEAYKISMWKPVKFKSVDGLDIPSYLTLPVQRSNAPAIVLVHGASHGSSTVFQKFAFLFAKEGFATLAVDYRSSSGHGEALKTADDSGPGGKEFDDVIAAVNFLRKHNAINAQKVAILGGSRGAYIAAYISTTIPMQATVLYYGGYDAAKMANAGFGEHNTIAIKDLDENEEILEGMENIPLSATKQKEMQKLLFDRSPINFVDKINGPVLLMHGGDDKTVPVSETLKFADALKKSGKVHELKIYPGAGHGFVFQNNSQARDAYERTLQFLNRYLK